MRWPRSPVLLSHISRARAILGLATLGEGLLIVSSVVPHESPLFGVGLVAAGALLLWRAELPRVERVRAKVLVACLGAGVALGVLAYGAWRRTPLDLPKLAILALGIATAAAVPFDRSRVGRVPVASLVLWSVPLAWAPLAVWAVQGALKAGGGTTPLETFTHFGLLLPLAGILRLLGRAPEVDGQVITYATPGGPLSLEVGVACSGIQAMALFGGIVVVLLVVQRPPWARAVSWCVFGIVGVYAVNVLRLVTIALVGSRWGVDALETTHANAGWMFFVAWSAVFATTVTRREPGRGGRQARGREGGPST